jgi:Domain of unknown function (DUF1996)
VTVRIRRSASLLIQRCRLSARRAGVTAAATGITVTALALASAPELAGSPVQSGGSAFPGGAYFNLACGFSHQNNDDPIRFPEQPGRSHNHTYIGNRTVHAFSTPATLRQRGESTCEVDEDRSTYWVPTLYVGTSPVVPYAGVVYYVRLTPQRVSAFPADLKIVAGNPTARRAQKASIASWGCGGIGTSKRSATVQACGRDDALELRVRFPDCWNGRTSDSANHKSHMAYAAAGRCPSSHPVAVPTLIVVLLYPPVAKSAVLSSGRFAAHADFMNGWDVDALQKLVAGLNY